VDALASSALQFAEYLDHDGVDAALLEGLTQTGNILLHQFFVGVDLEYPVPLCIFQIMVSGLAEAVVPWVEIYFIRVLSGNIHRPVIRAGVDDDDFVGNAFDAREAIVKKFLLVFTIKQTDTLNLLAESLELLRRSFFFFDLGFGLTVDVSL